MLNTRLKVAAVLHIKAGSVLIELQVNLCQLRIYLLRRFAETETVDEASLFGRKGYHRANTHTFPVKVHKITVRPHVLI